jgi:hypothetical protein
LIKSTPAAASAALRWLFQSGAAKRSLQGVAKPATPEFGTVSARAREEGRMWRNHFRHPYGEWFRWFRSPKNRQKSPTETARNRIETGAKPTETSDDGFGEGKRFVG